MPFALTTRLTQNPKPKPTDESQLGFGKIFTDHMLHMTYADGVGWHDAQILPFGPIALSPACSALHYAQELFEGLKCYRCEDGSLRLFRPRENFLRLNSTAERLCMPTLPVDDVLAMLNTLLRIDADWVPHAPGTSLYIRPFAFSNDESLGVHAAHRYEFYIILSPVGAYYPQGLAPVRIHVEDHYVRAVRGGLGEAKAAANYAASIKAGQAAAQKGYAQVLWLDGRENRYIEEVGAMNIMFVMDGKLVTPALTGSILPGITRDSVLKLAAQSGMAVEERVISLEEVLQAAQTGKLTEAFGTGTAAVISPVSHLAYQGRDTMVGDGTMGPVAAKLYEMLIGIQYGRTADPFGWSVVI